MPPQADRAAMISKARQMVAKTACDPWLLAMAHDDKPRARLIRGCEHALAQLKSCMDETLARLENGDPVDSVFNPQALPYYRAPALPDTREGLAARALAELMLLVVSIDPEPFSVHAAGNLHRDVTGYLNGVLHGWAVQLHGQWRLIGAGHDIFTQNIARPDGEKATLGTLFKAVCHALHVGPLQPSPFTNFAAQDFAKRFTAKLWPVPEISSAIPAVGGCALNRLDSAFQDWYFAIGKTQIDPPGPAAAKEAEDTFASLRGEFHSRIRACSQTDNAACHGQCLETALGAIPQNAFKDRCTAALRHIALQVQRDI